MQEALVRGCDPRDGLPLRVPALPEACGHHSYFSTLGLLPQGGFSHIPANAVAFRSEWADDFA
jgi:hypothetical protein